MKTYLRRKAHFVYGETNTGAQDSPSEAFPCNIVTMADRLDYYFHYMKKFKIHTITTQVFEITAEKIVPSQSNTFLWFMVGKNKVATFVVRNVIVIFES
jgi:hypothetical protein